MASWGLEEKVSRFPHGFSIFPDQDREQIRRELGVSRSPVIAAFGFLRPHKGVVELIESLHILRRRYPDVLLLAVTALYPDQESQSYYGRCLQKVAAFDLERHCKMVTDFLTQDEIMILLQTADVAVLAYHPINDSASGAVRFPLASHRPVVTTRNRVFRDISSETYQIKRATPHAIARGVTKILTDAELSREICRLAKVRVSVDSWENVAANYSKSLKSHIGDLH
jgi:glycosyltransferase involved in cell wall biosynthesis